MEQRKRTQLRKGATSLKLSVALAAVGTAAFILVVSIMALRSQGP